MSGFSKSLKGATAGSITLRLFRDLPVSQVGWLAVSWARYVEDGEEPDDVPAENLGSWIAVKEEADRIKKLSALRAEVGRRGGSKPKQTEANPSKPKQTEAEERRGEERRIKEPFGFFPSRAPAHAGETPVPPKKQNETEVPNELREAMKDAPITPSEAIDYAMGPYCGLTLASVIAWANYHACNRWLTPSGKGVMDRAAAESSLRRWRKNEPDFQARKKMRDSIDEARLRKATGKDIPDTSKKDWGF